MHAAETVYHGMIVNHTYGLGDGSRQVDGVDYNWRITSHSICVDYKSGIEVTLKCLDF